MFSFWKTLQTHSQKIILKTENYNHTSAYKKNPSNKHAPKPFSATSTEDASFNSKST